jgi:hypothetical protein
MRFNVKKVHLEWVLKLKNLFRGSFLLKTKFKNPFPLVGGFPNNWDAENPMRISNPAESPSFKYRSGVQSLPSYLSAIPTG